jgi:hypothetical protein
MPLRCSPWSWLLRQSRRYVLATFLLSECALANDGSRCEQKALRRSLPKDNGSSRSAGRPVKESNAPASSDAAPTRSRRRLACTTCSRASLATGDIRCAVQNVGTDLPESRRCETGLIVVGCHDDAADAKTAEWGSSFVRQRCPARTVVTSTRPRWLDATGAAYPPRRVGTNAIPEGEANLEGRYGMASNHCRRLCVG